MAIITQAVVDAIKAVKADAAELSPAEVAKVNEIVDAEVAKVVDAKVAEATATINGQLQDAQTDLKAIADALVDPSTNAADTVAKVGEIVDVAPVTAPDGQ